MGLFNGMTQMFMPPGLSGIDPREAKRSLMMQLLMSGLQGVGQAGTREQGGLFDPFIKGMGGFQEQMLQADALRRQQMSDELAQKRFGLSQDHLELSQKRLERDEADLVREQEEEQKRADAMRRVLTTSYGVPPEEVADQPYQSLVDRLRHEQRQQDVDYRERTAERLESEADRRVRESEERKDRETGTEREKVRRIAAWQKRFEDMGKPITEEVIRTTSDLELNRMLDPTYGYKPEDLAWKAMYGEDAEVSQPKEQAPPDVQAEVEEALRDGHSLEEILELRPEWRKYF